MPLPRLLPTHKCLIMCLEFCYSELICKDIELSSQTILFLSFA
jgi:hypothetical protein